MNELGLLCFLNDTPHLFYNNSMPLDFSFGSKRVRLTKESGGIISTGSVRAKYKWFRQKQQWVLVLE